MQMHCRVEPVAKKSQPPGAMPAIPDALTMPEMQQVSRCTADLSLNILTERPCLGMKMISIG